MKAIAYSILVYFPLIFLFKLLGDMDNNIHVNYYWIVSSLFYCFLFFKLYKLFDLNVFKARYTNKDYKLYRFTVLAISAYWGVMLILRVIVAFNIQLYDTLISNTRLFTLGGVIIILIYICLIYLTARKYDAKNEG